MLKLEGRQCIGVVELCSKFVATGSEGVYAELRAHDITIAWPALDEDT